MLLPDFLPSHLSIYQSAENEEQLLGQLCKNPSHLITFYENAASDNSWTEQHQTFMHNALEWVTIQLLNEKLPLDYAHKISSIIHVHHQSLRTTIVRNIALRVKSQEFPVNSLLVSAVCPYLRDLIRIECFQKKQKFAECREIPFDMLYFINEFAETGLCSNLWKQDSAFLFDLLKVSSTTQISGLNILCQETLKRYINRDNAFDMLLQAHEQQWTILKHACENILNQTSIGVRFFDPPIYEHRLSKSFGIDFFNFQESALEVFAKIKHLVTDIVFSGTLADEPEFSHVIQACPKLILLDIGRTANFSRRFSDIPQTLQELDLSSCKWLSNDTLRQLVAFCPNLTHLILSNCTQIGFQGWGELKALSRLRSLDISRGGQIVDEDFSLILQSCSNTTEFNMADCQKLTDLSFFELARLVPQLAILDVSRNQLSDGALAELTNRCKYLRKLNLTRCLNITDRGLLKALKFAGMLRELILTDCRIQESTVEEIRKQHPFLKVILEAM